MALTDEQRLSVVPCRKPLAACSQCSGRPGESLKADVVAQEEHMIRESSVANHVCADPLHYSAGALRVQLYHKKKKKNQIVGYNKKSISCSESVIFQ